MLCIAHAKPWVRRNISLLWEFSEHIKSFSQLANLVIINKLVLETEVLVNQRERCLFFVRLGMTRNDENKESSKENIVMHLSLTRKMKFIVSGKKCNAHDFRGYCFLSKLHLSFHVRVVSSCRYILISPFTFVL